METRSNQILVGAVTLILLALLAGFAIWLARVTDGDKKQYDIFFQQSVNGLAKGSNVTFSGVPVGQIDEIKLWEPDPEFVRVRIEINDNVPILQGTVATISGVGFTGVSEVQLDGAVKGAPPIACPAKNPRSACPAGMPVIPTKPGPLGELLNNAPLLIERLSTLTEKLSNTLSDNNQQSIEQILKNLEGLTGTMAAQAPELAATIADTRETITKAGAAADELAKLASSTSTLIDKEGRPAMAELGNTLKAASGSLSALEKTLNAASPAINTLNVQTLPEVAQLTRDLRQLSAALRTVTERLDQDGIGSLIGGPTLPDYQPGSGKRK